MSEISMTKPRGIPIPEWINELPLGISDHAWVYVVHNERGGIVYIGYTARPRYRMEAHWRIWMWWLFDGEQPAICWYQFGDGTWENRWMAERDARAFESEMIRRLRPPRNKTWGGRARREAMQS